MKDVLEAMYQGKKFSRAEAQALLLSMVQESVPDVQVAALLSALRTRGVSSNELAGFRLALQELAIPIRVDLPVIDMCGTGGDGKNTFNISTLAAFVVAACGVPVAKHGNYGVSSICGSSNVIEALGVEFTTDERLLNLMLSEARICILHAPLFHPAMKRFAPIRKALGVKTVFNLLGPLVNPCKPGMQYSGVYQHEYLRLYAEVMEAESISYSLVHSLDGFDEISLTGPFKHVSNFKEEQLAPKDFDLPCYEIQQLAGGDSIEDSKQIFLSILEGKRSAAQNDVVCINAAFALAVATKKPIQETLADAREALDSGAALHTLNQLIKVSKESR
ncbi:MAG: anthranilate phosphoribosyltransferase [Bdellovibrionales bacterium]|nr:anthranilate phosphoribosyltransferase [Bdellovibrionales bacterium]